MHTKKEAKDLELFRNWSVHEFYRLKALITLKQVISSVVEKKNNLNEQNFDGETNWSGDVNFHSITNESSDEHAVYFRRRLKWRTTFIRFPSLRSCPLSLYLCNLPFFSFSSQRSKKKNYAWSQVTGFLDFRAFNTLRTESPSLFLEGDSARRVCIYTHDIKK